MKPPTVTMINTESHDYVLAIRSARYFAKDHPDHPSGRHKSVIISYVDGSTFAVWWTKKRDITIRYVGQT